MASAVKGLQREEECVSGASLQSSWLLSRMYFTVLPCVVESPVLFSLGGSIQSSTKNHNVKGCLPPPTPRQDKVAVLRCRRLGDWQVALQV